jgi:hypothetical protein
MPSPEALNKSAPRVLSPNFSEVAKVGWATLRRNVSFRRRFSQKCDYSSKARNYRRTRTRSNGRLAACTKAKLHK